MVPASFPTVVPLALVTRLLPAPAARRLPVFPRQPSHSPFANWKDCCAIRLPLRSSDSRAFFPESWPVDRSTSWPSPDSLRLRLFLDLQFGQETARRFARASP